MKIYEPFLPDIEAVYYTGDWEYEVHVLNAHHQKICAQTT